MRHFRIVCALITLATWPMSAGAEVPKEVLAVGTRGVEVMKKLAETNSQDLGFASAGEGQAIEAGVPLREFMVRLDELAAFRRGSDPRKLLRGGNEYTFPVSVKNEIRSSFTVAKIGKQWVPVSFGSPHRTKLIWTVLRERVTEKRTAESFFLVKVPSLYYYFLAYQDEGTMYFLPLLPDTTLDLKVGEARPAEQVFEGLQPFAEKYRSPERPEGAKKQ